MPRKRRPGAAATALAISTTASVVVTPQRPAPQSISMKTLSSVPCFWAAFERSATFATSSTQTMTRPPCFGMRASMSIFARSRTWFEIRMSLTPARAKTSASETFWQQTPMAPPCSICSFSTSTDLCILPCARWRMLCARA